MRFGVIFVDEKGIWCLYRRFRRYNGRESINRGALPTEVAQACGENVQKETSFDGKSPRLYNLNLPTDHTTGNERQDLIYNEKVSWYIDCSIIVDEFLPFVLKNFTVCFEKIENPW